MEVESRRREHCKNEVSCPFTQRLCCKFNVTFTVNAELENDSLSVTCGG